MKKYIAIGFLMGFGWHYGSVAAKVGDRVLAMVLKPLRNESEAWVQRNGYDRRLREEETESGFVPKAVKNQIGFDY